LGFWAVRKLILTEDGSIDTTVSHFVAWSIWISGAVMILQVLNLCRSLKYYVSGFIL